MEELVEYCHRVAKLDAASMWKERQYRRHVCYNREN